MRPCQYSVFEQNNSLDFYMDIYGISNGDDLVMSIMYSCNKLINIISICNLAIGLVRMDVSMFIYLCIIFLTRIKSILCIEIFVICV